MIRALNMNPELIEYVVWKFGKDQPEINIDGHDLVYSQLGEHHHGMQCNHIGNTENHILITTMCRQIADLFREITELNSIKQPTPSKTLEQ